MDQTAGGGQFERQHCPLNTTVSTAFQSLDTVRALHQTVVSLRTALEDAHKEIDDLKKQILIQTDIDDGKTYRRTQDPPNDINIEAAPTEIPISAAENRVPPNQLDTNNTLQEQANQLTDETEQKRISSVHFPAETEDITHSEKLLHEITINKSAQSVKKSKSKSKSSSRTFKYDLVNQSEPTLSGDIEETETWREKSEFRPSIRVISTPKSASEESVAGDRKRKQMASKIDVKIRVSSNIQVNEGGSSASTSTDTGK